MKKLKKYLVGIAVLVLAIFCFVFIRVNKSLEEKALLSWLDQEEYSGILCFMHELNGYTEENYLTYIGKKVIQRQEPIKKLKDISKCIEEAFLKQPDLSMVYLELDPELIWKEANHKQEKWQANIEKYLMNQVDNHPETKFEIILSHPQLDYWTKQKEEKVDELLLLYHSFVQTVESRSNLRVFYLGDQEWLISNKDNYDDSYTLNESMGKHIFLSSFCDGLYQIQAQSLVERQKQFKELINKERELPTKYPDLSQYTIVFLGDSIYGMDRKSTSIPGVVKALSGATVYNAGEGGFAATYLVDRPSFLTKVQALESKQIPPELKEFGSAVALEEFINSEQKAEKLIFVINYGLNDYFQGEKILNEKDIFDVKTYAGALRKGIESLKLQYPKAAIVVMGATYVADLSEGNEYMSEQGGQLKDYILAAEEVAKNSGVYFKNNYRDLGINSMNAQIYMQDGCHFNPQGRLVYGRQLIEFLDKSVCKNN